MLIHIIFLNFDNFSAIFTHFISTQMLCAHSTHVRFYTFTRVLTVHQKNLNQIFIINGALSDRYECCSKRYVLI